MLLYPVLSVFSALIISSDNIYQKRNTKNVSVALYFAAAAAAKSLQSCPTLCDPIDGSPPGSPVLGILQERTLEWVVISFSNAWKWKVKVKPLSRPWLLVTPWTAAYQGPPSMGFSRQEYWSGLSLPSPYTLLDVSKDRFQKQIFHIKIWLKIHFSFIYCWWLMGIIKTRRPWFLNYSWFHVCYGLLWKY